MVVHICNPSSYEMRQEDYKFEVSLAYIGRPWLWKETKQTDLLIYGQCQH